MRKSSQDSWFERNKRLAGVLVAGAVLGLAEGALRLADPAIYRFVFEARQVHEYDPIWGVRLRPGTSGSFRLSREDGSPLYDFRIRSDAHGLRVGEGVTTADPAARVVHAIGDSFTMGWGLSYDESYPAVLNGLLGGAPRVLNLGVDGFGTIGATGKSREIWKDFPASAVVYLFSPNDYDDDERAERNAKRGPLFHGAMRVLDALRRSSYLVNTPFVVKWWLYFRPGMSSTGSSPADTAAPAIEEIPIPASPPEVAGNPSANAIDLERDFAGKNGARLVVLSFDHPEGRRFLSFCKRSGVEGHLLRARDALFIPGEGHLNARGSRQLALFVADLIGKSAPR